MVHPLWQSDTCSSQSVFSYKYVLVHPLWQSDTCSSQSVFSYKCELVHPLWQSDTWSSQSVFSYRFELVHPMWQSETCSSQSVFSYKCVLFGPSDMYIHWHPCWNWFMSSSDRAIYTFTDSHTGIGPSHLLTERYVSSLTPILELVHVIFGLSDLYRHWHPYWNWSMSSSDWAIYTFTDTNTGIGLCHLRTTLYVPSLSPILELVHVIFGQRDLYLHWHPYWNWSMSSSDRAICTFTDTHTWIGPSHLRTGRYVPSLTPILELVHILFRPSDLYIHWHPYWDWSMSSLDRAICTCTDTHTGIGPIHLRTERYVHSLTPILELVHVIFGPIDMYLHWHPYLNWPMSQIIRYTIKLSLGSHTSHSLQTTDTCINLLT